MGMGSRRRVHGFTRLAVSWCLLGAFSMPGIALGEETHSLDSVPVAEPESLDSVPVSEPENPDKVTQPSSLDAVPHAEPASLDSVPLGSSPAASSGCAR